MTRRFPNDAKKIREKNTNKQKESKTQKSTNKTGR
jgi:hypothetical protein